MNSELLNGQSPIVSVVIPVYNAETTLSRAIDSALSQTERRLEVVVVDDGSVDHSGEIADRYACRCAMVRVVHQQNRGSSEARRMGAQTARGEWLVPLDADDTLPERAVELLLNRAQSLDLDLVYGAWNRIKGGRNRVQLHPQTGVFSPDEFLAILLSRRGACGAGWSMSRRVLWLNDIYPPADIRLPSEDVLINLSMAAHIRRIGVFNDIVVYDYYYNLNSLSIAGALHEQALWRAHFKYVRTKLATLGLLDDLEQAVRQMELERFAFQIKRIDTRDEWFRQVINYPSTPLPLRSRVIQRLMRHPELLRAAININRRLKATLHV